MCTPTYMTSTYSTMLNSHTKHKWHHLGIISYHLGDSDSCLKSNMCCMQWPGSTPSCVAVYHMCLDDSAPTLSIGYTSKTNNIHQKDSKACFHVTSGCYWVAVFYLKGNDRMEGYPSMIQAKSRHVYTHCYTASIQ